MQNLDSEKYRKYWEETGGVLQGRFELLIHFYRLIFAAFMGICRHF